MSFFGKREETTVTLYHFEVVEDDLTSSLTDPDANAVSGNHCAWCGDSPDAWGSHSICAYHQAQMLEQAAARRQRKGRRA